MTTFKKIDVYLFGLEAELPKNTEGGIFGFNVGKFLQNDKSLADVSAV